MANEGNRRELPVPPTMQVPKHSSGVRRRKSRSMPKVGGTVLVVDDDPLVRASIERALTENGWDVVSTEDPQVALALCVREQPDFVLSDLDMPVLKGDRFAKLLHLAMGDKTPPIVIMTAGEGAEQTYEGIEVVLRKPVDVGALCLTIERIVAARAAEEEPPPVVGP